MEVSKEVVQALDPLLTDDVQAVSAPDFVRTAVAVTLMGSPVGSGWTEMTVADGFTTWTTTALLDGAIAVIKLTAPDDRWVAGRDHVSANDCSVDASVRPIREVRGLRLTRIRQRKHSYDWTGEGRYEFSFDCGEPLVLDVSEANSAERREVMEAMAKRLLDMLNQ